jgi:hypothetical protein
LGAVGVHGVIKFRCSGQPFIGLALKLVDREANGRMAEQAEVEGGVWIAHAALVFQAADIQALMQSIFNPPISRSTFNISAAFSALGGSLVTTYSYNGAGDMTAIDYSDSTPDVTFTVDRLGRQLTASSSISAHTFAYNGLLLDAETIVSAGITNIIDRSYDGYGRSTGFALGSDYQVAYGYDSFGRFSSVSSSVTSASSVVNYSYLSGSDLLSGLTSDL